VAEYVTRPLDPGTWHEFDALVERHGGVWGGCWCMAFHEEQTTDLDAPQPHRVQKKRLVDEDRTHAAIVFDGDRAVGWCQFGRTEELPNIKCKKAYEAGLTTLPEWRITCFFVDKAYRRTGVAARALQGALDEIARLGGGTVESYPEDHGGGKTTAAFLHNGTIAMFERAGFERVRKIAKYRWVVAKQVEAAASSPPGRDRVTPR
jgi:GNAT superfamily N-acetyltransferase